MVKGWPRVPTVLSVIRSRVALVALLAVVLAVGAAVTAGNRGRRARTVDAVVVLGDSAASGEGAGDYAPGTRGEGGDWCHRSPHAYIYATRLAPVAIDLACSGADTADVAVGGSQYGETAQVTQLAGVARRYRVTTVVVQIGANDDAALVATGITCIKAFLDVLTPPCRQTVGPARAPADGGHRGEGREGGRRRPGGDAGRGLRRRGVAARAGLLRRTDHRAHDPAERAARAARTAKRRRRSGDAPCCSRRSRTRCAGWPRAPARRSLTSLRATEGREACAHVDAAQDWQRRVTVDPHALVVRRARRGRLPPRPGVVPPDGRGPRRDRQMPGRVRALRDRDRRLRARPGRDAHAALVPGIASCAMPQSRTTSVQDDQVARALVEPLDPVAR